MRKDVKDDGSALTLLDGDCTYSGFLIAKILSFKSIFLFLADWLEAIRSKCSSVSMLLVLCQLCVPHLHNTPPDGLVCG